MSQTGSLIFFPFLLLTPGNDLFLLTMPTMPIESTENFISSSRYTGLITIFH